MENIGRAFDFCIKYWQQMEAFNDADEKGKRALLESLPADVREKIEPVSTYAGRQAADFLEESAREIEKHFQKLGNACTKVTSRRTKIETDWGIKLRLWPKGRPMKRYRWETGVYFEFLKSRPVLVLYVWARGGRAAEEKLAKIFGDKVKNRSTDFVGWGAGSVFIGEPTPLKIGNLEKSGVKKALLLEAVHAKLKGIEKRNIQTVFQETGR